MSASVSSAASSKLSDEISSTSFATLGDVGGASSLLLAASVERHRRQEAATMPPGPGRDDGMAAVRSDGDASERRTGRATTAARSTERDKSDMNHVRLRSRCFDRLSKIAVHKSRARCRWLVQRVWGVSLNTDVIHRYKLQN